MDAYLVRTPAPRPRIGLVVPRYGHSVAERNQLKRRLREILRREWLPGALEAGEPLDLVVRARPEAYEVGFDALRAGLREGLGGRAGSGDGAEAGRC